MRRANKQGQTPKNYLQNVTRKIFVSAQFTQSRVHIGGVNQNSQPAQLGGVKAYLVQQTFHDG